MIPQDAPPLSPGDFTRALLRDVRALERMLDEGLIESGVRRIGAEQEMVLVDRHRRPAPVAVEVLKDLEDERFVHELARFNIEVNLPPLGAGPDVLGKMERELTELVARVEAAAALHGADVALTGILPCLTHRDLRLENMTPKDRYHRLNAAIMALAGGRLMLHVTGTDELRIEHDSMMLEACNTSFQVHIQVDGDRFPEAYNRAQLVTAPVMAAASNSPFLFGKRLWAETRIAVFRQSVDSRASPPTLRDLTPRVRFGSAWVRDSVVELFGEDIIRFRSLMTREPDENPLAVLDQGGVPRLSALQMHNGTIYRWNRPCYGVTEGRPHLRIECRVLPAGPTVVDEVANAALWLGLVAAPDDAFGDIPSRMSFQDARSNFFAAARRGLHTSLHWLDGETVPVSRLILDRLLPVALDGLRELGMSDGDASRYLDVIRERVEADGTGSRWLERSAMAMAGIATKPERCAALTSALINRQRSGRPVHEWELARFEEGIGGSGPTVDQYMTTALLTLTEDEHLDLALFMMDRQHTRQVLIEDDDFHLAGVLSYRSMLELLADEQLDDLENRAPIREYMNPDPVAINPDTPIIEAIRLMTEHRLWSLPVIQEGKLVGILSERDLLPITAELLQRESAAPATA